ncbi:MAG: hypothetical protein JWO22_3029 [Frankiales bacterium]|nr:hypothetical protein [Frankiales bacterium]
MTSTDFEMGPTSTSRSAVATTALAAVALSAIGLVSTSIGVLMNAHGFQSKSDVQTPLSDTLFLMFVLGGLLAAIAGAAAFLRGRRQPQSAGDRHAAVVVAGYLVLAVLSVLLINLVNPNA